MTYLETLCWLRDNDYLLVVFPSETIGGVSAIDGQIESNVVLEQRALTVDLIANGKVPGCGNQYFVEVARNMCGEMAAYVYRYPKPDKLHSEISIAMTEEESVLPPDRLEPETGPGYFRWPYEFFGMRWYEA